MADGTYEILKAKYAPHLLVEAPEEVSQVRDAPVGLEAFVLQVRKSYLEGLGLNETDRHAWADNLVCNIALSQLEQAAGVKLQ
jgi:hypothetical protein